MRCIIIAFRLAGLPISETASSVQCNHDVDSCVTVCLIMSYSMSRTKNTGSNVPYQEHDGCAAHLGRQ